MRPDGGRTKGSVLQTRILKKRKIEASFASILPVIGMYELYFPPEWFTLGGGLGEPFLFSKRKGSDR